MRGEKERRRTGGLYRWNGGRWDGLRQTMIVGLFVSKNWNMGKSGCDFGFLVCLVHGLKENGF